MVVETVRQRPIPVAAVVVRITQGEEPGPRLEGLALVERGQAVAELG